MPTPPDPGHAVLTPDGLLRLGGAVWRPVLGRGGVRAEKQEGDGATPVGLLPLCRVLYRADRVAPPARCRVPMEPIAPTDGWCDDPAHPDYNRPVRLPHPARHEALWREDAVYDIIGVLGWNDTPVARGRGSAIFLHLARPDGAPTEGCIALPERDLRALLAAGLTAIEVLPPRG
jgi:L,D-peptidoglycan transpeptidase YkuD (ErfK/YbiS/YcfS/YnhG family)